MRNTLFAVLVAFGLMAALSACATGYSPPVSNTRGPAAAPSVAVETAWQTQPTASYQRDVSRVMAVHTNAAIGGVMYFESVAKDGLERYGLLDRICSDFAKSSDASCVGMKMIDDTPTGRFAPLAAFETSGGKAGYVMVEDRLGDKSRLVVCTGSWALYGSTAERAEQDEKLFDRFLRLCHSYPGY